MAKQLRSRLASRTLIASIARLRLQFTAFADTFTALTINRADFAPVFMRAFAQYQRETGRTFLAFVKELDPTVPADRALYPNHRSFQAALYLKRLHEAPETHARYRQTVTPFIVLAMVLRGVLHQLTPPDQARYWATLRAATGWRARDFARLQTRTATVRAVAWPNAPRLVSKRQLARAERTMRDKAADVDQQSA